MKTLRLASLLLLTSCSTLGLSLDDLNLSESDLFSSADQDTTSTSSSAESNAVPGELGFLLRSWKAVDKANEKLTPQQEYYLGRAFGAQIVSTRKPLYNDAANRYLNQVGQSLALFSDRPDTWAGYRFLLLDTDEVNAFAAPGGLIFVTKGLIKLTRNEAELAAVLAHEVAHVEREHGVNAVRQDRLASAAVTIGSDAVKTFGPGELRQAAAAFEDSIADLTKTIVNNGYSRETEFEADASALRILARAGYPPQALLSMLETLKQLPKSGSGLAKTHPSPDQRISEAKKDLGRVQKYSVSDAQKARFQAALGGL